MAFEHDAAQAGIPRRALSNHIGQHLGLAQRVFTAVGVTAVHHQRRRHAQALQLCAHLGHSISLVIGATVTATQHDMGVRITRSLNQRRAAMQVHAEVLMRVPG